MDRTPFSKDAEARILELPKWRPFGFPWKQPQTAKQPRSCCLQILQPSGESAALWPTPSSRPGKVVRKASLHFHGRESKRSLRLRSPLSGRLQLDFLENPAFLTRPTLFEALAGVLWGGCEKSDDIIQPMLKRPRRAWGPLSPLMTLMFRKERIDRQELTLRTLVA